MSPYKLDLLNHFKALQGALTTLNAEAFLDPRTFILRIRLGETKRVFYPQFMKVASGVTQYIPNFAPDANRFIGWCPYVNRRWPLATEKLLFKQFARQNALRTPEYSAEPGVEMNDVLVKRNMSSFAAGIRGPFHSSADCVLDTAAGEYFERFVRGRIAKIWYWNDRPVCLELGRMPFVEGNGIATIRQLARRRLRRRGRNEPSMGLRPFLEYEGLTLDTVLDKDREQTIDFRYGLRFLDPEASDIDLVGAMISSLEFELRDIGHKLWRGIPEPTRADTLFTVDAIVDNDDRIWVLEMNSNPFIHPYVYPVMLNGLFAAKKDAVEEAMLQI